MPDFSYRSAAIELMDDLTASGGQLHKALRELDAINYVLGGNYVTLNGLTQLLDAHRPEVKLRIADLGCGSGDMLRLIRRLLVKRDIDASLSGIDANPNVIQYAELQTPAACRIEYEVMDIFSDEFKNRRFDVVTGTLFFHHFTTEQLIVFLKQLQTQVTLGLIINDIHRHWFAYYSIKWLTRMFSKSPMVKNDAPVSVLRAFRKRELEDILRQAGISEYRIKWRWAFRWQVVAWFRP